MTSKEWYQYFTENLKKERVNWQLEAVLDPVRDKKMIRSLQAWQLGETSDGSHLLKAAGKYSERRNDPDYLRAISLFIKEEQKHGENLGKYLDRIGAERLQFDLGDWLFRRVRYFYSSIELWTVTVIIVETFAQLYYASLAKVSRCPLLKDICDDILVDEAAHIRFQAERLRSLIEGRGATAHWLTRTFYKSLFLVVTTSIWIAHGHVFKADGYSFKTFRQRASARIFRIFDGKSKWMKPEPDVIPADPLD